MSIVQDRMNAKKPSVQQTDPKTGKLAPGALNNDKDLDVDPKKDEPGFFNSFFAGSRSAQVKKKGAAAMDSVRGIISKSIHTLTSTKAPAANSPTSSSQRARDDGDRRDQ